MVAVTFESHRDNSLGKVSEPFSSELFVVDPVSTSRTSLVLVEKLLTKNVPTLVAGSLFYALPEGEVQDDAELWFKYGGSGYTSVRVTSGVGSLEIVGVVHTGSVWEPVLVPFSDAGP